MVHTTNLNRCRRARCRSACGEPGPLNGFSDFTDFRLQLLSSASATDASNQVTHCVYTSYNGPSDTATPSPCLTINLSVQFLHHPPSGRARRLAWIAIANHASLQPTWNTPAQPLLDLQIRLALFRRRTDGRLNPEHPLGVPVEQLALDLLVGRQAADGGNHLRATAF